MTKKTTIKKKSTTIPTDKQPPQSQDATLPQYWDGHTTAVRV
jgi:hypothetical protein